MMKARDLQKKIKLEFMLCNSASFMPSLASIYNLFFLHEINS